jgi:hypothetical protein
MLLSLLNWRQGEESVIVFDGPLWRDWFTCHGRFRIRFERVFFTGRRFFVAAGVLSGIGFGG